MFESMQRSIGIPPRYLNASIADFPGFEFNPEINYFLFGQAGCGKTRLLCAMAIETGAMGASLFTPAADIYDNIRGEINKRPSVLELLKMYDLESITEYYKTRKCLIIDDLGAERTTDWTMDVFYNIINHRYNFMLSTHFASNWNLVKLAEHYDIRVARRISEMCKVTEITFGNRSNVAA
jgi:DNA replication protein DnaC